MTSRRDVLKMGVALSAVSLVGGFDGKPAGGGFFSTGVADLDRSLGGGMLLGCAWPKPTVLWMRTP